MTQQPIDTRDEWEIIEITYGKSSGLYIQDKATSKTVCDLYFIHNNEIEVFEEAEANARLIAAAPETRAERDALLVVKAELVEVLKELENHLCEGFCRDLPSAGYYTESMDLDCSACRARAAIAKAEGGGE